MSVHSGYLAECGCGRVAFLARGKPIIALACYCADCQVAAKYVESLPGGRSGMGSDGGTVSICYPKQNVRCVRGEELLEEHRLNPSSSTTRLISRCCACSILGRRGDWLPHVSVRSFAASADPIRPALCVYTKDAPARGAIVHAVPQYEKISAGLALKMVAVKTSQVLLSSSLRMDWI